MMAEASEEVSPAATAQAHGPQEGRDEASESSGAEAAFHHVFYHRGLGPLRRQ